MQHITKHRENYRENFVDCADVKDKPKPLTYYGELDRTCEPHPHNG